MEFQLASGRPYYQSGSARNLTDDSELDSEEVKHICARMSHQYELAIRENRVADRGPGDRETLHKHIAQTYQI